MAAPVRIVGAKNPVNQIEFELERDNGELLTFTVPKAQYIPKPVMDEYEPWLLDWQATATATTKASAKTRAAMRESDPILKLLELLVPAETYAVLATLTNGELADIDKHWRARSDAELGESEASAAS